MVDHRVLHVLTHSFPPRRSADLAQDRDRFSVGRRQAFERAPQDNLLSRLDDIGLLLDIRTKGPNIAAIFARRDRRRVEHIRSEEHTSELQSLMRISYAVFCLQKKT